MNKTDGSFYPQDEIAHLRDNGNQQAIMLLVRFIKTPLTLLSSLAQELLPTAPAPDDLPTLSQVHPCPPGTQARPTLAPDKPPFIFSVLSFFFFWSFLGTLGRGGFHNE